jgi:putative hydrolase of HD superfamily
MSDSPSMDRLAELQQLIADFSKIQRIPPMGNSGRPENDVEHSFGLALTCWYLQPKVAPDLDLLKILQYALSHDIVELHAGDTFVFDVVRAASKEQRERDAIVQVKADWPDFNELTDYAEGYMNKVDPEARFVKAVDKLLPVMMIELDDKPADFWKKLKIDLEMERDNKVSILISEDVSPYYEMLITWLDDRNNIPKS